MSRGSRGKATLLGGLPTLATAGYYDHGAIVTASVQSVPPAATCDMILARSTEKGGRNAY